MKVILTGASSFSGMWLAKELTAAGHDVIALIRRRPEEYQGVRKKRVEYVSKLCRTEYGYSFGSEKFRKFLSAVPCDLFCHHAAEVEDYKSPDFNVAKALTANTCEIQKTLCSLNCRGIILTGSVFEPENDQPAVSAYGLSKGLTWSVFSYYAEQIKIPLAKFVIPNPFGPFEEMRFTSFLICEWKRGNIAEILTPDYVRDNIPVSLLAKSYVDFAERFLKKNSFMTFRPSFYAESQGEFTKRFAGNMEKRLGFACPFVLKKQISFPEPKVRVNTDRLDAKKLEWKEELAWDELAAYYEGL